jgi:hypothetical protein
MDEEIKVGDIVPEGGGHTMLVKRIENGEAICIEVEVGDFPLSELRKINNVGEEQS